MSTQAPPTIDPNAAQRWQHLRKTDPVWLHDEVERRMQERLSWITRQPASFARWASNSRNSRDSSDQPVHHLLRSRYPKATEYVVTTHPVTGSIHMKRVNKPWWHPARWCTWSRPPIAGASAGVDMVWANMALHMSAQPGEWIAQWHKLLAVDGFLMFSCFGPDTLRELRGLYQEMGWPEPAHEFTDMHDWGDMLVQAGFAEPVMDMERITLSFQTPQRLLQELRELGRNLHVGRFAGLRGKGWLARLKQALHERLRRDSEGGQLCLSFEIVYGHAFKPAPRLGVAPQTVVSLDEMRQALAAGKSHRPFP